MPHRPLLRLHIMVPIWCCPHCLPAPGWSVPLTACARHLSAHFVSPGAPPCQPSVTHNGAKKHLGGQWEQSPVPLTKPDHSALGHPKKTIPRSLCCMAQSSLVWSPSELRWGDWCGGGKAPQRERIDSEARHLRRIFLSFSESTAQPQPLGFQGVDRVQGDG